MGVFIFLFKDQWKIDVPKEQAILFESGISHCFVFHCLLLLYGSTSTVCSCGLIKGLLGKRQGFSFDCHSNCLQKSGSPTVLSGCNCRRPRLGENKWFLQHIFIRKCSNTAKIFPLKLRRVKTHCDCEDSLWLQAGSPATNCVSTGKGAMLTRHAWNHRQRNTPSTHLFYGEYAATSGDVIMGGYVAC